MSICFLNQAQGQGIAFEVAAKGLNADIISIAEKSSSLTKGESLRDTARNIQSLGADAIVLRHSSPGSPLFLSEIVEVPVINAGDGAHEHPSQALLIYLHFAKNGDPSKEKRLPFLGTYYLAGLHAQISGEC